MAKTKIIVIQMKEIIYTAIFVGLGILLILLLVFMFAPGEGASSKQTSLYTPGVYTSQIKLGDSSLNLEVTVDQDDVKSVSLVNMEQSVTTMYPLISPSVTYLEEELKKGVDPSDIVLTEKGKYTQTLLLDAITQALDTAKE